MPPGKDKKQGVDATGFLFGTGKGDEALLTGRDFDEAEDTDTGSVTPRQGAGERPAAASGIDLTSAPVFETGKPGKGLFTAKGTVKSRGLTDAEALAQSVRRRRVFEAEQIANVKKLDALGVAESKMIDYANFTEESAEELRELHEVHFPRAQQRMQEIYDRVDAARSLKVNPFNYQASIGRGGRVSSAFAVLTGQMAAGAGNPNSALKMLDSAIERDISAQEQNIKNTFTALKTQSGLTRDERALHMEQLSSINTIRATAYAGMTARIGAAKQTALNESHGLALKVAEDHYQLKLLDALQAARQEILQIEIDGPISAAKLRSVEREIARFQEQLTPTGGQAQVPTQRVTDREGRTLAELAPDTISPTATVSAAQPRAAAVAARRGRKPSEARGVPVEPAGAERGPSAEEQQALQSRPVTRKPIEDETSLVSRLETEDEAQFRETGEQAEKATAEAPARTLQEVGAKAVASGGQNVDDREVARALIEEAGYPREAAVAGGFGRAIAKQKNFPITKVTSVPNALRAYGAGQRIKNDGLADVRDAQTFSEMTPPPQRRNYRTNEAHGAAMRYWRFTRDKWEVFEAPATQNTIQAGGISYRVRNISPARRPDATGTGRYVTISDKLQEGQEYVNRLRRLAISVRKIGPGGGMFNTNENGLAIFGFTSTDPEVKLRNQNILTTAMGFIKSNDPTARLSDKDVEIGERAMGEITSGKFKLLDFIQSFDGQFENNTVRKGLARFYQALAIEAQRAVVAKFQNDLVPDYNTSVLMAEETDDIQTFLNQTAE